jgi:hypothetical protein
MRLLDCLIVAPRQVNDEPETSVTQSDHFVRQVLTAYKLGPYKLLYLLSPSQSELLDSTLFLLQHGVVVGHYPDAVEKLPELRVSATHPAVTSSRSSLWIAR